MSCRHRAKQTQRLSHSVYQEVKPAHVKPEEKMTSWFDPMAVLQLRQRQRLSLRAEAETRRDDSPLQPLQLQPLTEIFIMFDSSFTYENKHKSGAFLPPPLHHCRETSAWSASQPAKTRRRDAHKKGGAGCRQRSVKKKKSMVA